MYAVFMDEHLGYGDYCLFCGCANTKADAEKLVEKCAKLAKNRVIDDTPTKDNFTIKKMKRNGLDYDAREQIMGE